MAVVRRLDTTKMSGKAKQLSAKFEDRIVGQPKAVETFVKVLEKYQSGFYDKTKPIASLLFLGPTGVGKTGSVEAFVEGLFGDKTKLMKIDCGEYQHSHEIAKLIGSPPGYLGHRETHPFFTNKSVEEKHSVLNDAGNVIGKLDPAFTVILFDEIEKASDSLWNLLLGILDKGSLTTGSNEKVDLTPTVIVMTSNVGSVELAAEVGDGILGFRPLTESIVSNDTALNAARRKFQPEFINRLDAVVTFNTLTPEHLRLITGMELNHLRTRIVLDSQFPFEIVLSPSAFNQLAKEGYDKRYNARELKRTIDKHVANPLSRLVAAGQIFPAETVVIDYNDGGQWSYFAETTSVGQNAETAILAG